MKWSREKKCSEQCVKCGGKRPRIYWKWFENFDVIFHVTPGVVDNLCVTLKQSGEVNEIRSAFTTQPKIYDGAFLRK